jgi:hypothetical protein
MPVYQYEGKFYQLPDGLSNEQAIAKIQAHLGVSAAPITAPAAVSPEVPTPSAPVQQPQAPQQRSIGQEIMRQLGLTARAGYEAFTAPATAVLEAGRGLYNLGAQAVGSESRMPSFYQEQAKGLTAVGLPEPETGLERAVQAGTQAMAGTAATAKMLPNVPAMAAGLQRQIPAAAAAGMAGQPAAEITKEITGSDLAATIAGIGVSAITASGAGKAINAIEQRQAPLYTMQEIKQRATDSYTKMDQAGVSIKPKSVLGMVDNIRTSLDDARMVPGTDPAKAVMPVLDEITNMIGSTRVDFTKLEKMRGMLNDLKVSKDADVRRLAGVAVDTVDNYITGLTGRDIIAGSQGLDTAVKSVMEARKDWRNLSRATILDDALNVAQAKELDPKASGSELIRRGFINIAANKDKMKSFTKEEQNIIKSVAKGGSVDPILTFASQFSPLRSKLAAAAGAYGITQSPTITAVVGGTGLAADLAQTALRRQAAQTAIKRIASGQTEPPAPDLAYRGLLTTTLNPPIE